MSTPGLAVARSSSVRFGVRLDPRTKLLLVVGGGAAIMAPSTALVFAGLVVAVLLAGLEAAFTRMAAMVAISLLLVLVIRTLPMIWQAPLAAMLISIAALSLKFVATVGIALHLLATTTPSELNAALRALRTPRPVVVALAVVLRFVPTVVTEARAVADAMRLRGLGGSLWRHPVRCVEWFSVPMIASSLRIGEDLSAAALLRGLGSPIEPTTVHPPRFGAIDLFAAIVVAGVVYAAVAWQW